MRLSEHLTRAQFEPQLEQLLARISNRVVVAGECWEYRDGPHHRGGYGNVNFRYKRYLAHRLVYALVFGETPGGEIQVCHRCDNPPCVRPHHLFTGTLADNMNDKVQKGRHTNPTKSNPQLAKRGEESGGSKITESQVREIRRRRARGETFRAIAADYPIREVAVWAICVRKTWAHVS